MVSCCVPSCKTNSNNPDNKGIPFHEFPLNPELAAKWIGNINRRDWKPKETTRICGLHFTANDYRQGLKIQKLFPGSVPTVFTHHHHQHQPHDNNDSLACHRTVEPGWPAAAQAAFPTDAPAGQHRRRHHVRDATRPAVVSVPEPFDYARAMSVVSDGAIAGDPTALFLQQQLQAYVSGDCMRWSDRALQCCILWRSASPSGYQVAVDSGLLCLPTVLTLDAYIHDRCVDIGLSPDLVERLMDGGLDSSGNKAV